MARQEMTAEQRYWYLKGYIECLITDLSYDKKISEREATKMVVDVLSQVINSNDQ